MTKPPDPDVSCVRCHLIYDIGSEGEGGNRFYLSYSGSTPTTANLNTLASDIAAQWETHIAPLCNTANALEEVDVLDITTDLGNSGTWTGSNDGSRSGSGLPCQITTNVGFEIARRYRGGKPRIYLPAPVVGDEIDAGHWSTTFVTAANTGVAAFFTALEGLSIGSIGTLQHINLSYYDGFVNVTNSSGRTRAAPKYRTVAKSDPVTGYKTSPVMSSQRRRRTSTSP